MTKRFLGIAVILMLISSIGFGQKKEINNAFMALNSGELEDALKAINLAAANEETKDWPKTWVYKGNILMKINDSESDKGLVFDPLGDAYKAYAKAVELDAKGEYKGELAHALSEIARRYYNLGVEPYSKLQFGAAYKNFSRFIEINKILEKNYKVGINADTANFLRAYSAYRADKLDDAKTILTWLMDSAKYRDPEVYHILSNISLEKKDTTGALALVERGRKEFPDNNALLFAQINIYIFTHKYKEAVTGLNEALVKAPNSPELHYNLGISYDNMKDTTNALKAYKKAIELKPDYFEAYYSIGAEYFNTAVEVNKTMNNLGTTPAEQKKYDAMKINRDALFMKAIPYLEKARSINGKDLETLNALKELYSRTNQLDKAAEIKTAIEGVGK